MSFTSITRIFGARPKAPAELAEQSERLATTAELTRLRPAR
ncbi:hypothetical protein [Gordonia humi]|uniref:Uncharacterized protein n=1 Tax=Gordonia humi TaxID=686429 RepID=A0A840EQU5_9ACTN|nr:hypothetical protein [Gordonia humi]MBB4133891.1 hypothetical protein [Gordonia humi]